MRIQESLLAVEFTETPIRLEHARKVIEAHLAKTPENKYETRGTYYYHLLRISLESHILFEKEVEKHFYKKLSEAFAKQEREYLQKYFAEPKNEVTLLKMKTFYQLMEKYFTSLEVTYRQKDFGEAERRAYLEKMQYRKKALRFLKERMKYLLYKTWELTSLYSLSFSRWGVTCLVTVFFYAWLYFVFDGLQHFAHAELHWYDAIHFSIATFTTLGFGDVFPMATLAKIIADLEVFTGYLMLGAFMGLVQKRAL